MSIARGAASPSKARRERHRQRLEAAMAASGCMSVATDGGRPCPGASPVSLRGSGRPEGRRRRGAGRARRRAFWPSVPPPLLPLQVRIQGRRAVAHQERVALAFEDLRARAHRGGGGAHAAPRWRSGDQAEGIALFYFLCIRRLSRVRRGHSLPQRPVLGLVDLVRRVESSAADGPGDASRERRIGRSFRALAATRAQRPGVSV